jgi:hypothetical protein
MWIHKSYNLQKWQLPPKIKHKQQCSVTFAAVTTQEILHWLFFLHHMNHVDQSGIRLFQPFHPCFQILVSFSSSLSSGLPVVCPLCLLLSLLLLCRMLAFYNINICCPLSNCPFKLLLGLIAGGLCGYITCGSCNTVFVRVVQIILSANSISLHCDCSLLDGKCLGLLPLLIEWLPLPPWELLFHWCTLFCSLGCLSNLPSLLHCMYCGNNWQW